MSVKRVLRYDLPASLVVFLIAIPLSLGIAAASGAPLLAGIVAAVAGGIVAGALGGAPLQVSGPAAGLTVIVAETIDTYGFAGTAAIVALAGVVQIALGALRLGRAALALSPAVVHGMLAGIGMVIALGQLHVVLGGSARSSAWENIRELPGQIASHHAVSVLVGVLVIGILVLWPRLVKTSLLPGALVAVVAATVVAAAIDSDIKRVDLPLSGMTFPQWPDASVAGIVIAVVTIALVASVESLLSAVAVDRMHDGPRARLNRELVGQGAANIVSGLLGGLPVTGVIVRSSTNVASGARSRASAILHGVWILALVLLAGSLLEMIPMAALAAVLVVIGLRLISFKQIKRYARHRDLPPYVVTAIGVVATDLLTGVALGMATALVIMLWRLARCEIRVQGTHVTITGSLVFLGAGRLTRELSALPAYAEISIALHLDYLDHGAYEALEDWRAGYERAGGTVTISELRDGWFHRAASGRLGNRRLLAVSSKWLNPHRRDALAAGIRDFEQVVAPHLGPEMAALARDGQRPGQLFITCADSRVVPNLITASGPGDLFCLRNVGNIVPPYGSADSSAGAAIDYAVTVLGVRTITVCGHSTCGAVQAMLAGTTDPASPLGRWLAHAATDLSGCTDVASACRANVTQQLENLRTYPSVRDALAAGTLTLTPLYFDLATSHMQPLHLETH